jgi:heme/copper-type cytochrome/quinol oxidase subunit 4
LFDDEVVKVIHFIQYMIVIVFATDCILGFRKAYLDEKTGQECRDPKSIAKNYIKTFFFIDLMSGIPFDLLTDNTFLKLLSLIKVVRLKRLERVITYLQMENESRKRIRIMYLVIRIVMMMHWVACSFYNITHDNWQLVNHIVGNTDIEEREYMTKLNS